MTFEKEFFLDEVRDGFLIPSMMKKQWAICLEDYDRLASLCKKNGLMCFGAWGTLIGAIRHGGFVPWDDDMDFEMLREDFEKLVGIVGKDEKEGEYHIDDFTTQNNTNMVRRWMEKSVLLYGPERWEDRFGFPFGNAVDIFVQELNKKKKKEYDEYMRVIYLCETLRTEFIKDETERDAASIKGKLAQLEKIIGHDITINDERPPEVQAFEVLDEYFKSVTKKLVTEDKTYSKRAYPALYIKYPCCIHPVDVYEGGIEIDFEGMKMMVPYGYDSYLRRCYGDFMNPVYIFANHPYPAYDILKDKLKEEYGFELLRYKFDREEYENNISQRQKKKALKDVIGESVGMLREAHDYLRNRLTDNTVVTSESAATEIKDLLGQCQALAVQLGTEIEAKAIEGECVVKVLETYCEEVYRLYEMADDINMSSEDESGLISGLNKCDDLISDDAFTGVIEYTEVVFLIDRAENLRSLRTIIEASKDDQDVHVTVIPVPYKYKDACGVIPEGEWETDDDLIKYLSEGIELTPYDAYDFEMMHPEMIIYQNPYDEFSDVISVQPFFYASNLCKYTDKMVFIPPFKIRELVKEDQRGRYTLETFIRNPGTVYADKIIVQSEEMKTVYEELLSDMTDGSSYQGEEKPESVIDWESRLSGIGSALTDIENIEKRANYEKRRQVAENPIVLFYISASMLYDSGLSGMKKMKDAFDTLRGDKECGVYIKVLEDPYAKDVLSKHAPGTLDAHREFIKECRDTEGVEVVSYDRSCDLRLTADRITNQCDAFYGDAGVVMHRFRLQDKPLLWENPEKSCEEEGLKTFAKEISETLVIPEESDFGRKIWVFLLDSGGDR